MAATIKYTNLTDEERFYAKVEVTDSCHLWTGQRHSSWNYGYFSLYDEHRNRIPILAHRFAYILKHGPIPDDLDVLHTCDVGLCIRDEHLYLGTDLENARDRELRHREEHVGLIGEENPMCTLLYSQVLEIKGMFGIMAQKDIAEMYSVSPALISMIKHNKVRTRG